MNKHIHDALKHVHSIYPEVVQVFYGVDCRWRYCDVDWNVVPFDKGIDTELLEKALGCVGKLPAAYGLED